MQWGAWEKEIELVGQDVRLGRADDNDLTIPAPFIAPHHALLETEGDHYRIQDISGWQGLLSHGQFVHSASLQTGFSVRIGDGESNLIQLTYFDAERKLTTLPRAGIAAPTAGLATAIPDRATEAFIGRDPTCTFVLDHPMVGRRHAVLKRIHGDWILQDLHSRDGTYLNGRRISHAVLTNTDIVQIGPYSAVYYNGAFEPVDPQASEALRIDVIDVSYEPPPPRKFLNDKATGPFLLNNVRLSILAGEFSAIVGGSGTGKSTLMRLLAGLYEPSIGVVLYNGLNLATYRSAFARSVGYVPQDDIVHQELTVEDALQFAARLRLPADLMEEQLRARLDEVLEAVDLNAQRGQLIRTLSGGQRKRVSIAVELLPQPRLLFLDEPTSGLDPGLDKRMMFLLRRLADRGHTVILVTHTPAHLDLCDNVIFMGTGGHVTFFGPPHLVTRFFGQADLADVFSTIDSRITAAKWAQRYANSSLHQENVVNRQRAIPLPKAITGRLPLTQAVRNAETFRQCTVLVKRQFAILGNDRTNLCVLLLQAPIIAALIAMVSSNDPFNLPLPGQFTCPATSGTRACGLDAQRLVFIMACAVVWFGTLNSVREIVKERAITIREQMVGVLPLAYLAAKVITLGALGLIQAPTLLIVIALFRGLPASSLPLPALLDMTVTLVLGVFAGIAMGLVVSAVSPTSDRAMSFAPFLLLPQILFSGVLFGLGSTQIISFVIPTRWAAAALGDTARLYDDHSLQPLYTNSVVAHFGQWLALLVFTTIGLSLTYSLQKRHKHV